jgi:hypothetical protein
MPKLEERMSMVSQMHEDLGHVGEQRTLAESVEGTSGIIELKMLRRWSEVANNASWSGARVVSALGMSN